ncbi:hypothetical protein PJJ30_23950 [Mycobacterium kansasii]|uniref:UsfY protein n=1 Tax=Mycobacterium persicum TaxID=1487726 RepID=A0ABY6RSX1_9MYCO|nr:hypothetical protein [Mycobacterium persicum]VAZ77528.1 hypothetical protein LAUMK15_03885 [Mycobacterium persicum]VBA33116.1 hypothetical protein LAUMK4_05880 [Mycobacterium persicum]
MRTALLIAAIGASVYAVAAFVGQLETDCYIAALVAILALGGVIATDYLGVEHDRRIREERARTWARRDGKEM